MLPVSLLLLATMPNMHRGRATRLGWLHAAVVAVCGSAFALLALGYTPAALLGAPRYSVLYLVGTTCSLVAVITLSWVMPEHTAVPAQLIVAAAVAFVQVHASQYQVPSAYREGGFTQEVETRPRLQTPAPHSASSLTGSKASSGWSAASLHSSLPFALGRVRRRRCCGWTWRPRSWWRCCRRCVCAGPPLRTNRVCTGTQRPTPMVVLLTMYMQSEQQRKGLV
jgi:hypothetical protein